MSVRLSLQYRLESLDFNNIADEMLFEREHQYTKKGIWRIGRSAGHLDAAARGEQKNRKTGKKLKKPNREKKQIKILKKLTGSVRFRFYKPKTEKTEPNRTQTKKKPEKNQSQTWKNWAKPVWTDFCPKKPNRTETGRFELVSVFFSVWLLFFDKNRTELKMISPSCC